MKFAPEEASALEFSETYFARPQSSASTFSLQFDAGGLSSGRYFWIGEVTFHDGATQQEVAQRQDFFAFQDVINRDASPFGSGWQLDELDRLVPDQHLENEEYYVDEDGVSLITGDNRAAWFRETTSDSQFTYFEREENPYVFADLKRDNLAETYILTYPDASTSTFDLTGLLLFRHDRLGNVVRTYEYTGGLLDSVTDIVGRTTTFDYDSGLLSAIHDPYDRTTELDYDAGRLVSVTQPDPDGTGPLTAPVTTYAYLPSGVQTDLLKSITDPRGLTTTIQYDATRHVSQITEPSGGSIQITSIPAQLVVDLTSTGYDANNLAPMTPTTISDPDDTYTIETVEHRLVYGKDQYITRNVNSHITSLTDAQDNVTKYTYESLPQNYAQAADNFGLLNRIDRPDPDAGGPLTELVTAYSYDAGGHIDSIFHEDSTFESFYHDSTFGQLSDYYDQLNHLTWQDIESGTGNILSRTQVVGNDDRIYFLESDDITTSFTYTDASDDTVLGLLETVTDPNGNVTHYTYNGLGQVETAVYAEGTADEITESYEYDDKDRLWKFIDGRGNVTEYQYDSLDRLIERIDADPDGGGSLTSPEWQYRYDRVGNQTHVIDPLGNVTETVYDVRSRPSQVIQPVADPNVTPTVITKDDASGVTFTGSWTYLYPVSGALSSWEVASTTNGASAAYTFTGLNPEKKYAVVFRWQPTGATYDKNALAQVFGNTSTDALNELRIDLNATPQGLPDGAGYMWQSMGAFSPYNNTLTVKLRDDDNNGKLLLDAIRLVEVGPVTQTVYDFNGNLVRVTDPMNRVTEYEYDELNRLTERIDPDPDGAGTTYESPVTEYAYNAVGWLTSMTDPDGNVTFYQYDELGRLTDDVNVTGSGLAIELREEEGALLDKSVVGVIDYAADPDFAGYADLPDGFSAEFNGAIYLDFSGGPSDDVTFYLNSTDYSELYVDDQLIVTNSSGPMTGMQESSGARTLASGWHRLKVKYTDVNYDSDDGLIVSYDVGEGKEVIPAQVLFTTQVTTTDYDAAGRVEAITDPVGNTTSFDYDDANRLTGESIEIDSETLTREYVYDDVGNLKRKTDRNGRVTTYDYDHLNRLTGENWLDSEVFQYGFSWEYDEASNLTLATDSNDVYHYEYQYDNLNRRKDETQSLVRMSINFDSHDYDAASRLASLAVTLGTAADYKNSYQYDNLARMTRITQAGQSGGNAVGAKRVDLGYNLASQLDNLARYASTTTTTPVATTDFGYDLAGRLTSIDHAATASGSTFAREDELTYFDSGRLASRDSNYYSYDATGQLVQVYGIWQYYGYDANGNRDVSFSASVGYREYTTDSFNRLTSDGVFDYQYDDEGNVTRKTDIASGVYTTYTWDRRNRLIQATDYTAAGAQLHATYYGYDAFNQLTLRVETVTGGLAWTVFAYQDGQVVLQFDRTGYTTPTVSHLSHRFLWADAVDNLLADEQVHSLTNASSNDALWALADNQGSVRDVVDSAGKLRIERAFDAFGNVNLETHYNASGSTVTAGQTGYLDEAFSYTGRWFDQATGLQNNLNRWYDAAVGRWMSEDPIGFEGGDANLYRYVANSPTTATDPSGQIAPVIVGIGIGAFWGWWSSPNVANAPAPGDLTYPDPGAGGCEPGNGLVGAAIGGAVGGAVGGLWRPISGIFGGGSGGGGASGGWDEPTGGDPGATNPKPSWPNKPIDPHETWPGGVEPPKLDCLLDENLDPEHVFHHEFDDFRLR